MDDEMLWLRVPKLTGLWTLPILVFPVLQVIMHLALRVLEEMVRVASCDFGPGVLTLL